MKLLNNDLEKADQACRERALKINNYMIGLKKDWFTVADLRRMYETDLDMQKDVFRLSQHGFLQQKTENNIMYFQVIFFASDRLKLIELNLAVAKGMVKGFEKELSDTKTKLANWRQILKDCQNLPKIIEKQK